MSPFAIVGALFWLVCSLVGHWVGRARGRPVAGFFFGLLLGPIGCLIVGVLPRESVPSKFPPPAGGWKK